jgi:transcriptional regulator with XRE-family HTH domain
MHIGLKIKMVRIAKGISQQELGDLINRTRPLISHIEQTGQVNEKTLESLCKALKISEKELDNYVNEPKNSYKNQKQSTTDIFDEVQKLKDENKILKDLIQSQKEIIELLRGKKATKK